ncbi:MAG: hypothetical protein IJC32_00925 [Clostridia bacterium]|nr:hypothetical protein [Clostridia bacterium]
MPGTLFDTDTSFPRFTGEETDSEKIQKLQDYLYQLAENFRYLMSNLGIENFNATELEELGTTIRKPVLVAVEKTGEKITKIEANIGRDIKGIKTQVTEIDKDVETNKTTIEQTSKMIAFVVEEKEIDGKTQFVLNPKCLTLSVEDDENGAKVVLTSNGTEIDSDVINLKGFVTFSALEGEGQTTINGAVITTGIINASVINGGTIYGNLVAKSGNGYGQGTISGAVIESVYDGNADRTGKFVFLAPVWNETVGKYVIAEVASIHYDDTGSGDPENNRNRLFIRAKNGAAIKLESDAGISVVAKDTVHIEAPNINLTTPDDEGVIDIGSSKHPATVRVNGNTIS